MKRAIPLLCLLLLYLVPATAWAQFELCGPINSIIKMVARNKLAQNIRAPFTDSSKFMQFDPALLSYPKTSLPDVAEGYIIRTPEWIRLLCHSYRHTYCITRRTVSGNGSTAR